MAKETQTQQKAVGRVMHEFKHHQLRTAAGEVVRDPRQAIAIGLSEAGASDRATPAQNRRNATRTRAQERGGQASPAQGEGATGHSRSELYAEARRRDIPNRSRMNKAQLARALAK